MAILVDTGFLYAILDNSDAYHRKAISFTRSTEHEELVLPSPVLVELTYFIASRLGHAEMRRFIGTLPSSQFRIESLTPEDIPRVKEILDQYADAKLDYVDASVTTLAERLNITKILTVDHRDFGLIRPRHCDYFEILP